MLLDLCLCSVVEKKWVGLANQLFQLVSSEVEIVDLVEVSK